MLPTLLPMLLIAIGIGIAVVETTAAAIVTTIYVFLPGNCVPYFNRSKMGQSLCFTLTELTKAQTFELFHSNVCVSFVRK